MATERNGTIGDKMQKRKVILYDWASPCGRLTIGDTEGKLVVVDWTGRTGGTIER